MEGLPIRPGNLEVANAQNYSMPHVRAAMAAAAIGDFENAEKELLSAKPPWLALIQQYRDAHRPWEVPLEEVYADMFAGWAAQLDSAKAKWEEGAPARAAEWEKGAPARKAAEEIARLKAEIARVEQEEVDRQAALAKEALEKLRIQKEEEEEKQRKAEVTALERDAAALRQKLAAMKELMALKAADPLSYAAACASPSPAPPAPAASPFRAQDFMSKAQYRKLRETNGFPLASDQHVCHIIAQSNGGADHIDNYYVAAGSLNQSLGNRNDFYLAEAAGLEQTKKAVAVSRTTGYTGLAAEDIIDMAKTLRAKAVF